MANITLKDIQFPGINNTYTIPEVDNTLTQSGAAADAKKTGDELGALKEDFNQNEYYYGEATVPVTAGTPINEKYRFDRVLPAGTYSISFFGYELLNSNHYFFVSLMGENDAILTQTQRWEENQNVYVTVDVPVYGIAVYAGTGYIAASGTIKISILRKNRVTNDEDDIYFNRMGANKTAIGFGFATKVTTSNLPVFTGSDDTAGIQTLINTVVHKQGMGKMYIPRGVHIINTPIFIEHKCIRLDGEVWNYPDHPNGVIPSTHGAVLKLNQSNIYGIELRSCNGFHAENFGIIKEGRYSEGLFDRSHIEYNTGIYHKATYTDQIEITKVNFSCLASAFAIGSGCQLDAAYIHNCNMDGCNIGIIIDNTSSIYTKICDNLIADTPAYGLFMKGNTRGAIISNNLFVRNAGKFTTQQKTDFTEGVYGVYISGVERCSFTGNHIEYSGQAEVIGETDTPTTEYDNTASGLYFNGVNCVISNNVILGARKGSAEIAGSLNTITGNEFRDNSDGLLLSAGTSSLVGNKIMTIGEYGLTVTGNYNTIGTNAVEKKIKISGNGNTIVCSGTNPVIIESGATNNILIGFDRSLVTDNGTGTIFR